MKKTYCTVCRAKAVQRVVRGPLITFRCEGHKVKSAEARKFKWKLYDMTKEAQHG